ncbi:hypothetical protein FOL47_002654 [Perkinsus chesapeaki]|uniref:Uncharacterized protein n=1 Tax=Perkinsus chesapeaki TaxID=330153 RepID=A0A7J6MC61_PERCH|nr:hypothetical protein FOL47_002654 [Perkinsus chesapeaki]
MSFERLAIHDPVWCGMSTLDYMSFYCFNGTVDVRIQNKLWWNVEILDGLYIVWRPRLVPAETQIHYYTQVSTLNVVEVPSKSDRTYTLKTVCVFPEALARFDLTAEVLAVNLNIRVLGYNFHIANQKQKQDTLVVDLRDSAQKELPSN